ncbi:hypothetical protein [Elongatibacter sediminis]|uniref:Uncharacterized protein n=1 Tax=Elongatibacter sediminis TaxID=3119006 RepID=A0AAW9R825_9GAMM
MRFMLILIIVLLLAYKWWPRDEPPPVEETFIGDQIQPLRKAERFQEKDYNDALDRHREKLDAATDDG